MALDLCTLNELKQYIEGMPNVDRYDYILSTLITSVSKRFESYCNRIWDNNSGNDVTEYFSGDGSTDFVIVKRVPIASITTLHDDPDREYNSDDLIAAADYTYYADEGRIQLDGIRFLKGLNNVKVTYKGGYTVATVPGDLKLACILQTTFVFKMRDKLGISSISSQAGSVSMYSPVELLPEVKQTLDLYKMFKIPL